MILFNFPLNLMQSDLFKLVGDRRWPPIKELGILSSFIAAGDLYHPPPMNADQDRHVYESGDGLYHVCINTYLHVQQGSCLPPSNRSDIFYLVH